MADENNQFEPSLDDIFSRIRKEDKDKKKEILIPFKFLDPYTSDDKNIFFGRDNETEDIFRKLYSGKLMLVYGKSGTGKSSIINCGLISKIPQEDIFAINIRCGKKPYNNFLSGIKKYSKAKLDNPLEILEDIFYENSKPIALIFDQFEEIFILADEEERKKLANELNEILKSRLKINIVLVIREEYYANLTEFEPLIPELYRNRTRIESISKSAAKEIIIKPCKVCNIGIEEGLADKIIEQLVWQSGGLELTWLQIVMDKLYKIATNRDPKNPVIKHDDLTRLGRMGNVLSDFLDEQLQLMPNGEEGEAVLKTMISTDGTKKQVTLDDISHTLQTTGKVIDNSVIEEILRYFINVRILTDKDEQGFYELRHDGIAAGIFKRMTAIEKELIEIKTFIDNGYKNYIKRKVLFTGNDLKYISLYENKLYLKKEIKEFIKTSKKEVQKTKQRRRNIVAVGAISLIIILSGFTLWALNARRTAIEQTKIAEEQKNEAIQAKAETENARENALEEKNKAEENAKIAIQRTEEATLANVEAEKARLEAIKEKNNALENARIASQRTIEAENAQKEAEDARNEVIKTSKQQMFHMYMFNGKELANKSLLMQENDTLQALLSLYSYELTISAFENYSSGETELTFDPEILKSLQEAYLLFEPDSLISGEIRAIDSKNNKIVYSNNPGQVILSKLEEQNPEKFPSLKTEFTIDLPTQSLVRSISMNHTTTRMVCGTNDGNVILFENFDSDPNQNKTIYNHNNNRVLFVDFIPGKEWLVSTATDKTAYIWDLNEDKYLPEFQLNADVNKIVPAGSDHLLFTNSSGQILDWNLANINQEPEILYNNENTRAFNTLDYNALHNWLAVASVGNIMIFNYEPGQTEDLEPEFFNVSHSAVISHLAFSPDNNWLVSASPRTIMLWDLREAGSKDIDKFVPIVISTDGSVFSLTFDEESKYLIYGNPRLLHIYPIDIKVVYSKLKLMLGEKELDDSQWQYYVKGDLEKPEK